MPRQVEATKTMGNVQTKKPKIDIWMPMHGNPEGQTMLSLISMLKYEWRRGVNDIEVHFLQEESLIPRARNTIANNFLETDSDYLLMIDADLMFLHDSLSRLLLTGHKLIGANYAHKTTPIKMAGKSEEPDLLVSPADFIPTGFMLIHRDVLEILKEHTPVYGDSNRAKVYGFFNLYIDDDMYLSEDWSFSKRCKNNGLQGYIDNTIRVGHIGRKIYMGE